MCCFIASHAFVFRLSVFSYHNHFYSFAHFACFASDIFTIPCSRKVCSCGSRDCKIKWKKYKFIGLDLKGKPCCPCARQTYRVCTVRIEQQKALEAFRDFFSVWLRTCIFLYVCLCVCYVVYFCVFRIFLIHFYLIRISFILGKFRNQL